MTHSSMSQGANLDQRQLTFFFSVSSQVFALTRMPVNHSVIIYFRRELSVIEREAILLASRNLPTLIHVIRSFKCGFDLGLSSSPNMAFSLSAEFDSVTDYKSYQNHPSHIHFVETHVKPNMSDRKAIQYEF